MTTAGVNIPIKATVDAAQLGALEGSINALKSQLKQAKADFEAAAPGSAAWKDAAQSLIALRERIMDGVRPLREMAEAQAASENAQRQLTAAIAAGVNPWTTASAKYREAQQALQAQTAAAKDAAQASAALSRAKAAEAGASRQDAVANAQRQMIADMHEAEAATRRLKRAADDLPPANDKVEKSSGAAGRSILEFSRMVEDAQYGIAGILNNIPTLVAHLGMGAGLAGAFSLAAVGGTLLYKVLSKANFDGTWMGDVKDAVKEMVSGMSKAEEEARKIAEAPATWAKTVEEEFEARSKLAEQAMEREIELLNKKLEIQKSITAAKAEEVAHAEKLHKIQNPNYAEKGSEQWANNETATKRMEWQTREAARVKAISDAEDEKLATEKTASIEEAAAATERKKADDLRKRETNDQMAAQMEADAMAAEDDMQARRRQFGEREARRSPEYKSLEQTAMLARRAADQARAANEGLHFDSGTTAGAADKKAKAAEEAAREARKIADTEAREFEAARVRSRQEQQLNDAQLKRDRDDIGAAQFEKAAKDQEEAKKKAEEQRTGKDRTTEKLPETDTAPAPAQGVSNAQIGAASSGLAAMANASRTSNMQQEDPQAAGTYREGLGALNSALRDGQGDTSAELNVIKEMQAKIANGSADRATALREAVAAMEALQADGSQMQQKMAAAFSAVSSAFRAMRSDLDGVINEMGNLRENTRR